MKIAQISTSWLRTPPVKYGGTEAVVSSLTEQLVALGHDVTLFATGDSATTAHLWSYYDTPAQNFNLLDEVLHVVKAYEYISQSNFDIVHNHTYSIGPALLSLSSLPNVTTYHTDRSQTLMHYHQTLSLRHNYIAISQSQRRSMPELNWIGTVHNGIRVDDFTFESEKDDYFLFVGQIAYWKGPHLAIQVAKALGCRLKIAGPIPEQAYFEREIAPHIDGHMIEYVGEADFSQKVALYQHAKALLVTIDWEEPFGMVMIEALACGTPVLAFARGAAPEIVVHGRVGFLAESIDEMVTAARHIASISHRACREHVECHFSVQLMAERYVELYQNIIKEDAKTCTHKRCYI